MSNYYVAIDKDGNYVLAHAGEWGRHKYIRKEGNRYIYPEDLRREKITENIAAGIEKTKRVRTNSMPHDQGKVAKTKYYMPQKSRRNGSENSDYASRPQARKVTVSGVSTGVYRRGTDGANISEKEYSDNFVPEKDKRHKMFPLLESAKDIKKKAAMKLTVALIIGKAKSFVSAKHSIAAGITAFRRLSRKGRL